MPATGPIAAMRVGVAGLGRWGSALAAGLTECGLDVRTWQRHDWEAGGQTRFRQWAETCEVLCLAVRDDQLIAVVDQLATVDVAGKTVIHHAGAVPLDRLDPLARRGARIGKLHPLQSFSEPAAHMPRGIPFAIEGAIEALVLPWIETWEGQAHYLSGDAWATYHLAAVTAANFLPLFIREGAELLQNSTPDQQTALDWLAPLVRRSVEQALDAANRQPFSGPAARNDRQTMDRQLELLSRHKSELAALYREASAAIRRRLDQTLQDKGEQGAGES